MTTDWFHADTLRRIFCGEVVALHPFHRPPGLFDACELLIERLKPDRHGMIKTRRLGLDGFSRLREAIKSLPQCVRWNTPRKGKARLVFVSRHWRPSPEYDFIDIDALARNVSHDLGRKLS